jgi:hypothetical protein
MQLKRAAEQRAAAEDGSHALRMYRDPPRIEQLMVKSIELLERRRKSAMNRLTETRAGLERARQSCEKVRAANRVALARGDTSLGENLLMAERSVEVAQRQVTEQETVLKETEAALASAREAAPSEAEALALTAEVREVLGGVSDSSQALLHWMDRARDVELRIRERCGGTPAALTLRWERLDIIARAILEWHQARSLRMWRR